MYLYEIPDFKQKKVRRKSFPERRWLLWDISKESFRTNEDELYLFNEMFSASDWELFQEPAKKEKIKQYRANFKNCLGEIYANDSWSTRKPNSNEYSVTIVAIEEREIEISPDGVEEK